MRGAGYVAHHLAALVQLDEHTILGQLLLDQNNLLSASGNKVTTRVQRALVQLSVLLLRLAVQVALAAPEHDRYATNDQVVPDDALVAPGVLYVDDDLGRVGEVPEAALLGIDGLADAEALLDVRRADVDVEVFDVEVGVGQTGDLLVGFQDVLDLDVGEVVERVQVLLEEPFDLQVGWHHFLVNFFFSQVFCLDWGNLRVYVSICPRAF